MKKERRKNERKTSLKKRKNERGRRRRRKEREIGKIKKRNTGDDPSMFIGDKFNQSDR